MSTLALFAPLTLLGAAGPPAEEILKADGLKRSGATYVHESETLVRKKVNEARLTYKQLGSAHAQLAATEEGKMEMLQEFENQRAMIREELMLVEQNMANLMTPFGGNNNFARVQYNQLTNQRQMLNNSLNQLNRRYVQLQNQANDPNVRKEIAEDLKKREDSHHKAVKALRAAVDATLKEYAELEKNHEVSQALDAMTKAPKMGKVKLGPSKEFLAAVRFLEKMEQEDTGMAAKDSGSEPSKKGRRSTSKTRRPARSGSTSDMPSSFPENADGPF
jgi:hypothetical protein